MISTKHLVCAIECVSTNWFIFKVNQLTWAFMRFWVVLSYGQYFPIKTPTNVPHHQLPVWFKCEEKWCRVMQQYFQFLWKMWCKSDLAHRKQCICTSNLKLPYVKCSAGIPQGSLFGPLLFVLCINDLLCAIMLSQATLLFYRFFLEIGATI